ncbi:NgrE (modular protein) [Xenorhabdus nematophila ATCC 19061]|uniref:NgrE (Modular protein) n=1 Tax=Xenorhabdus nematophila (strain ATCC 19061 / DSM 3370 / CCUG 14189 / LMG 1036 / NCIMB 9965 / AN6) TaxID=406817 RepID=D3VDY9_XENNA|nr:NgrE [Xenorhabdus nematophila]CBJ90056.1 NgrE (modular protein) [Xenorhabdus nematophila ATCC 19061]CEK22927.1 NgrE (modular protein) [Xenorhabdus nematophila AN6/1]
MYSQGTISTVSGSAIVRGTGTKFIANINGVAPAQLILIQSGNGNLLHMIQAVNSDTELVLADNAKSTLNNVTYQIQTTVPDSVSDGIRHIVAINSYIVNFLQNMDKWMSQNGAVDVTLPNGQTVSLQSIRALQATVEGKLDKNKNGADIQDTAAFVENLGLVKTVEQAENAYPKTGGTVNGEVHADRLWTKTSLNLGSGIVGDRHGMALTSKDDASFEGNNVEIRSWNGIGFKSTYSRINIIRHKSHAL